MATKYQSSKTGKQIDASVDYTEKLPIVIDNINKEIENLTKSKAEKNTIPQKLSDIKDDITEQNYDSSSVKPQSGKAVAEAIAKLLGSAPENLDTLEELAKALNEDENFSATVLAELAKKQPKENGKGLSSNDFTDTLKEKLENNTFDGYYVANYNEETDEYEFNFDEFFFEGVFLLYEPQVPDDELYTYYILAVNTSYDGSSTIQLLINLRNGEITQRSNYGVWKKISVSQTDLDKKVDKVDGRQLSAMHYVDLGNLGDSEITEHLNEFKSYGMYHLTYNETTTYGVGQALMSVHGNVDEGIVSQTLYRFIGGVQNDILYRDYDETEGVWGDWQAQYLNEKRARDIYTTKTDLTNAIGDVEKSLENIIQKYGLGGDAQ